MRIQDYPPCEILRPFIKCYRIIDGQHQMVNRVLPNTSIAIAFRVRGVISYALGDYSEKLSSVSLSGLRKSPRLIKYDAATTSIIVLFKEGGAAAFFKEPLYELFEKTISLDALIHPSDLSRVEEQLADANSNEGRIPVMDKFFLGKLQKTAPDRMIDAAVGKIRLAGGNLRMKELPQTLYMSTDAFEKRFRKVVGTSPKQFASIVRMSSIVQRVRQKEKSLDNALDAGFYDQAHFVKAFRAFTGQTPTDFARDSSSW
jgi:AraC-like DNA-binding protein